MTKSDQGNRWFGIDYHMNLYKGCNMGCIYCDSRCEAYHIEDFDKVKVKENALEILEEELNFLEEKNMKKYAPIQNIDEKINIVRVQKYGPLKVGSLD